MARTKTSTRDDTETLRTFSTSLGEEKERKNAFNLSNQAT